MDVRIDRIRRGITNCYLVRHEGVVLVDCGMPGGAAGFLAALARLGLRPGDLRLIVLTHGHSDHAGAAGEISALTGAPIALHQADARWLDRGMQVPVMPRNAAGRLLVRALCVGPLRRLLAMPPFPITVRPGSADLPLSGYGIPGMLVHTPGHTAGSMSLLLEDGRALVGSAALGPFPPVTRGPRMSIIADDEGLLAAAWRALLARGVTTAHPAHGGPFPAEAMRNVSGR